MTGYVVSIPRAEYDFPRLADAASEHRWLGKRIDALHAARCILVVRVFRVRIEKGADQPSAPALRLTLITDGTGGDSATEFVDDPSAPDHGSLFLQIESADSHRLLIASTEDSDLELGRHVALVLTATGGGGDGKHKVLAADFEVDLVFKPT